jgi:threonine/homoserine/homoserine lactone efflux protein
MSGTQHLGYFVLAILILSAIPGPDMVYIIGRSVSQGRLAGATSVAGISTSLLFHSAAVAFGLSALLAASQTAFNLVKYAGAIYLIWLGIQALRAPPGVQSMMTFAPQNLRKLYIQGFLTGLLNPKTTLFFTALLPQFVKPEQQHSVLPFLFLGLLVTIVGSFCDLSIAITSAWLSRRLRGSSRFNRMGARIAGALYIGLGLNLLRLKQTQVS